MHITQFAVYNYKSFAETPMIDLTHGINVVTGQNNTGKTALLESLALSPNTPAVPHRSLKNMATRDAQIDQASRIAVSVVLSNREFLSALSNLNVLIPLPKVGQAFGTDTYVDDSPGSLDFFRKWFFSQPTYTLRLVLQMAPGTAAVWYANQFPSFGLYEPPAQPARRVSCNVKPDHSTELADQYPVAGHGPDLGVLAAQRIPRFVYRFTAERFNMGVSEFGSQILLQPRATNLPEVLGVLQSNRPAFDNFVRIVRDVLPQVGDITVRPEGNRQKILVWAASAYEAAREDLAVGLNESGTGIGQVLAILYVVLTSHDSQVILIDEPQSFLHPGAARKLVEVLKQHPEHQYIIATHSPTIITAAKPEKILLVIHDDFASNVHVLESSDAAGLRKYLDEIGASFADVYGADNILWVEGFTEEKCYPIMVERLLKRSLMGTVIKAVIATDDFRAKHGERFFDIYHRLSTAQSLIPVPVGFLFDDEGRSKMQKDELQRRAKAVLQRAGKPTKDDVVRFTRRRMYENYLLDTPALTAVLNSTDGHTKTISEGDVRGYIASCSIDPSYFTPLEPSRGIEWIHAANVLEGLFRSLAGMEYLKTRHSVELTEWLVTHDPEKLSDVAHLIREALGWSN